MDINCHQHCQLCLRNSLLTEALQHGDNNVPSVATTTEITDSAASIETPTETPPPSPKGVHQLHHVVSTTQKGLVLLLDF